MNQYRAIHPSFVALHGEDVFDADLSVVEERDALRRGFLEIVPRPYRVMHDNYTVDGKPVPREAVIELALPVEHEAAMLDGGHLERVRRDAHPTVEVAADPDPEPEPAKRARRKAATTTSEQE